MTAPTPEAPEAVTCENCRRCAGCHAEAGGHCPPPNTTCVLGYGYCGKSDDLLWSELIAAGRAVSAAQDRLDRALTELHHAKAKHSAAQSAWRTTR